MRRARGQRRLWQVFAEVEMYVWADDKLMAEDVAQRNIEAAVRAGPADCEIHEVEYVPERAVVYGEARGKVVES